MRSALDCIAGTIVAGLALPGNQSDILMLKYYDLPSKYNHFFHHPVYDPLVSQH